MKKYFISIDENTGGTVSVLIDEENKTNILVHTFPNNIGMSIMKDATIPTENMIQITKEKFESDYWNLMNGLNKIVL